MLVVKKHGGVVDVEVLMVMSVGVEGERGRADDLARRGEGRGRHPLVSKQAADRCSGPRREPLHLSPCSVAIEKLT